MVSDFDLNKEVEHELIYGKNIFPSIKNKFPSATYEDASDFLREDRIAVSIPGVTYRDFFGYLLDNEYECLSFLFQFLLLDGKNKDFIDLVVERRGKCWKND